MVKSLVKSKHSSFVKTRKQIRKEKRKEKKIKRNERYLNKNVSSKFSNINFDVKHSQRNCDINFVNDNMTPGFRNFTKNKLRNLMDHEVNKECLTKEKQKMKDNNLVSINNCLMIDHQVKESRKQMMKFKDLEKQMKLERKRQMQEANEAEDKIIKSLEKKLKLNRRKNKSLPKSFTSMGLDYLLEVCDYEKYKDSMNLEKELNNTGVEFEDDFHVVTGYKKSSKKYENKNYEKNNFNNSDANENRSYDDSDEYFENDDYNIVSEEVDNENNLYSGEKRYVLNNSKISDDPLKKKKKVTFTETVPNKSESVINEIKRPKMKPILKKIKSDGKQDTVARLKKLQHFVQKENNKISEFDCDNAMIDHDTDEGESSSVDGEESEFQEDIYGRLRDKKGNVVQDNRRKYIPPHLRAQLHETCNKNSEVVERLTKQMKGALNRLTEKNLYNITTQIEDLYMKYSRNDSNNVFLKLMKESLISPVLSPERIVIEHAVLISVLHANIGTEIGAFILQRLVEELDEMFKNPLTIENKEIDNVIMILSQLYNFKIFHSSLIYEILKKLTERFQEKDIELILMILKNVGFNLRKDDPISLKEMILNIQKKANDLPSLRENARVRFMLDTLLAVKNNNMLKIPNYDPSYIEHLKKIQHKSLLRPGKYVTELKISMDDLLNADTRGRWWIVGSAWNVDSNSDLKKNLETNTFKNADCFDQKILNMAKKQRMNTDTRRNIFCILMTAEDFVDAFEKLMKLELKGQQYQEIIHVLVHCLLKEKQYNPYYSFLAEQLCSINRKYQLAIQFCIWDKLKELDTFSNQQIVNLAKFLTYLFLEFKLPLSILKVLQFTEMNKPMVKLIRQIMLAILLQDNKDVIVDIFSRISKSEKLFMLREGLQLFLHHFVLKNVENTISDYEEKLQILPKRVELAINSMQVSTVDF